jgi:hypothetical protein
MNPMKYHGVSQEELEKLATRQLMALKKATYRINTCGCPYHCGDGVLTPSEREYNNGQYALRHQCNLVLQTREHIPDKIEAKSIRQRAAKSKERVHQSGQKSL